MRSTKVQTDRAALAMAMALASFLVGCAGDYSAGFRMLPGTAATATFSGDRPFVTVRNDGPGTVAVTFDTTPGLSEDRAELAPGSSSASTLWAPRTVRIENNSDRDATVELTAQNADGMVLNGPLPK